MAPQARLTSSGIVLELGLGDAQFVLHVAASTVPARGIAHPIAMLSQSNLNAQPYRTLKTLTIVTSYASCVLVACSVCKTVLSRVA